MGPHTRPARRRLRVCLRPLVMIGVVGALLFGDLISAQADIPPADTPPAPDRCDPSNGRGCCELGAGRPKVDSDSDVLGEGRLRCFNFTPELMSLRVSLARNGREVVHDYWITDFATSMTLRVWYDCSPGRWETRVTAMVTNLGGRDQTWSSDSDRNITSCPGSSPSTTTTTTTRPCPNPPRCHPE